MTGLWLGRVSRHVYDRQIFRLPRDGEPRSESDKKEIMRCLTRLDNASAIGAHHRNLGEVAAETRKETVLAECRLWRSTDFLHERPINAQLCYAVGFHDDRQQKRVVTGAPP